MLIRPSHSAVLATCLRNLGWRPVVEGAGPASSSAEADGRPRIAVPALARQPGSRLTDPGLWQWWELAQPAQWHNCGLPTDSLQTSLQRVLAVTLGDAFLARAILEQGPRVAPAVCDQPIRDRPGARSAGVASGRRADIVRLLPAAMLTPFKD